VKRRCQQTNSRSIVRERRGIKQDVEGKIADGLVRREKEIQRGGEEPRTVLICDRFDAHDRDGTEDLKVIRDFTKDTQWTDGNALKKRRDQAQRDVFERWTRNVDLCEPRKLEIDFGSIPS